MDLYRVFELGESGFLPISFVYFLQLGRTDAVPGRSEV
jgi:hypothetical protein